MIEEEIKKQNQF